MMEAKAIAVCRIRLQFMNSFSFSYSRSYFQLQLFRRICGRELVIVIPDQLVTLDHE
jgi:hypothetical protein